jgi:hypothetical protein
VSAVGPRRKGIDWERAVARAFQRAMPRAGVCRRPHLADVTAPRFWIETKRAKRTAPRVALRQAIDDAPLGVWPIAVCRADRLGATVTMRLEDFLQLVGEWSAAREVCDGRM